MEWQTTTTDTDAKVVYINKFKATWWTKNKINVREAGYNYK